MYKIWVRIKGSVAGTNGYFYSSESGIYRTDCRNTAKLKCFALYGEYRRIQNLTSARYDFKVVEAI